MTTKKAVIASIVLFALMIGGGFAYFALVVAPTGVNLNQRAEMFGRGLGIMAMIPIAIIWILWAANKRNERS